VPAGSERNGRSGVTLRANGRDFELPQIAGTPLDERLFIATYYDTPERRLARAGITLRRRMENGNNIWELVLPREPEPRILDARGGPVGPPPLLARLLSGIVRNSPLEEVQTVRTRRGGIRVVDRGVETVEVLVDSKAVLDGRRIEREFTEISLRPLDGDERPVRSLSKELRGAGAERVRRPATDEAPEEPGTAALKAALRKQHARMLAHDPGVRLGDDPEDVHQLRVATRRVRAFLRAARRFFADDRGETARTELAWLADLLGDVRDLDVLIERIRDERTRLDLPTQPGAAHVADLLVAEREAARGRLLNAMRTKRYVRLLARIEELAENPPLEGDDVPVEKLARREFKKLRRAAAALDAHPSDDEVHKVRVRAKRARYAAEVAEETAGKPATRFIKKTKRLQDIAGELQDAAVAEERLRALSERVDEPGAGFAAGLLVERARVRRAAARDAFPKAWSRVEKSGLRAWA
jgi:CHAD domain-containing protein